MKEAAATGARGNDVGPYAINSEFDGKGLRVIESFSEGQPRLTATEAGELAGLARTAARRYLVSLVHYGYAGTGGKHAPASAA